MTAISRSADSDFLTAEWAELVVFRNRVDRVLDDFLAGRVADLPAEVGPRVATVRSFAAGGKRLRPLFCYCGWLAAGGRRDDAVVAGIGAALELFHAGVLIHDDVMDDSRTRRGRPTVHRAFSGHGAVLGRAAERFGVHMAILLGDLCLVWSDDLLCEAERAAAFPADRGHAVRAALGRMRAEVFAGQYLDVDATSGSDDLVRALRIVRYKTAGYTVEKPLGIGALAAGAGVDLVRGCTEYGVPLGEAFQLRDDLLGVFGDPAVTGKPAIDDLRAGKRTVLMAVAGRRATSAQRSTLRSLHGDPDLTEAGAERLREIIRATEADRCLEDMISDRLGRALAALERVALPEAARHLLTGLAHTAVHRDR